MAAFLFTNYFHTIIFCCIIKPERKNMATRFLSRESLRKILKDRAKNQSSIVMEPEQGEKPLVENNGLQGKKIRVRQTAL